MDTEPVRSIKFTIVELPLDSDQVVVLKRGDDPSNPDFRNGTDCVYGGKPVEVGGKKIVRATKPLGAGAMYQVYRAVEPETGEPLIYRMAQTDTTNPRDPLFWQRCQDFEFHPRVVAASTEGRPFIVYKEKVDPEDPSWMVVKFGEDSKSEDLLRLALLNYEAGKSWLQRGFSYTDWQDDEMVRFGRLRQIKAWRVIDFEPKVIYPPELAKPEFRNTVGRYQFTQQESISTAFSDIRSLDVAVTTLEKQLSAANAQDSLPVTDDEVAAYAKNLYDVYLEQRKARSIMQKLGDWMNVTPTKTLREFTYEAREHLQINALSSYRNQISELQVAMHQQKMALRQRIDDLRRHPDIILFNRSKKHEDLKNSVITYIPEKDEEFIQQILTSGGGLALFNLGFAPEVASAASELPANFYRRIGGLQTALGKAGYNPLSREFDNTIVGSFIAVRIEPILKKFQIAHPEEVNKIRHQINEIVAKGTGAEQFLELEEAMNAIKSMSNELKKAYVVALEGELRIYDNAD